MNTREMWVLEHMARQRTVDVRTVSEVYRQTAIDLAMREPPLVDIDADRMFLTAEGKAAAR